jgi:hypothetical protein
MNCKSVAKLRPPYLMRFLTKGVYPQDGRVRGGIRFTSTYRRGTMKQ